MCWLITLMREARGQLDKLIQVTGLHSALQERRKKPKGLRRFNLQPFLPLQPPSSWVGVHVHSWQGGLYLTVWGDKVLWEETRTDMLRIQTSNTCTLHDLQTQEFHKPSELEEGQNISSYQRSDTVLRTSQCWPHLRCIPYVSIITVTVLAIIAMVKWED